MAEKDIAEKILEAYDDVFADIVNGLLFDGEEIVRADALSDQSARAAYKVDGKLREHERDVLKHVNACSVRIASVGFENQSAPDPDMPLRVYGYDGAEYMAQTRRKNRGKPRYPVITLVLYFGYEKHWDKPLSIHEAVDIPPRFKPFVQDVRINLFEIAWLTHEQVRRFKSDFRIVADYFVQMREKGDYEPSPENLEHVQATLQLLSVMTQDHRFEDVYNSQDQEGGVKNMCEFLDRVESRGIEKGIEKGIEQGAESKAREMAINLYRLGMKPEEIAGVANETLEKVERWLELAPV